MRRRKLLLGTLAALLALAGVAAFALWPRPQWVTRKNFRLIRVGMSRAEVYAILGPSGDYRTGPPAESISHAADLEAEGSLRDGDSSLDWQSDEAWIYVTFDGDSHVRWKQFFPNAKAEQNPLENLRWRVKRQCRRWFP